MNGYKLRTYSERPLIPDDDAPEGSEWPLRQGEEVWTAVVEAEGSSHVMFRGHGASEREAIESLRLVP